jgi:selenium metabolism protein YedF
MIKVDAMGDTCPIPVVKAKNAIKELNGSGQVEVLVDNEIAVQNLTKMANQKGYAVTSEKLGEGSYRVVMTVGEVNESDESGEVSCIPDSRRNTVVVISSSTMGNGDDELGAILIKGFIFALTQQDELPSTVLFYNGGAKLTCEDAPTLDDLKTLEAQGVEILTCGTCLNHYGLTDKLKVGSVTNMYVIVEKMSKASLVIRP